MLKKFFVQAYHRVHKTHVLVSIMTIAFIAAMDWLQQKPFILEHPVLAAVISYAIGFCTNSMKDSSKQREKADAIQQN